MDYDLARLGDKQFEHLALALLVKYLGPAVQVFGAGPDGGREAAWNGPVADPRLPSGWDGYGVAQAKYMHRCGDPKANLSWLRKQIAREFREWTKDDTRRQRLPEYYLVITNVTLSAASGGGIDAIAKTMTQDAKDRGLSFRGFAVWHYDQLRVMLDDASDLRATYAAWTTPGDVLARLVQASNDAAKDLADALRAHTAKVLIDDRRLNLTQAGSVNDGPVGIADVFIDLPAYPPRSNETETKLQKLEGQRRQALPGIVAELLAIGDRKFDDASLATDNAAGRASRTVLIGGPGQGKSTIGQYLCQIYRASFLAGSPILAVPEVREIHDAILSHADQIRLARPGARRWPIRIVLSDLADKLANHTCKSVLEYITQQLSGRSGLHVTLSQVRAWLREYPWFVVFDGLDEVPQASNRGEVLLTISDFFIDVRSVSADVLVLATSRPQGYNDDFGREQCRHYELAILPRALAVSYAKRLIDVRTGPGSDRAHQISARLERASKEDSTSRLLTTPLQVTILTLLLERLGHAPRDRWRLFSQYYRVIYQREQEKGGDLAELLHTHESDVHAIHFQVGLLLQQRGERSGDTRGALTLEEFKDIIAQRLESQGNDRGWARELADRLTSLATDRLVFLATLGGGEIGFEIRSLQEFMAAEALLARSDDRAVKGLGAIATSLYWRNVFLFAAGRVFADKEHLRSDVLTMCADLNLDTRLHEATLPGSRLALDILRERVTNSQPAFTRVLADCASQLLRLPPSVARSAGLEGLRDLNARAQLFSALDIASRGSLSQKLSAVAVLAAMADTDDVAALNRLAVLLSASEKDLRRLVLTDAYSYRSPTLVRMLQEEIAADLPSRALSIGYYFERELVPSIASEPVLPELPLHLSSMIELVSQLEEEKCEMALLGFHPEGVALRATKATGSTLRPYVAMASIPDQVGPWLMVKRFAEFTCAPSMTSLAEALEAAANHPLEAESIGHAFAWPLAACLTRFGDSDGRTSSSEVGEGGRERQDESSRYVALAAAARVGLLGDERDWQAAESRWQSEHLSLEDLCYVPEARSESGLVDLPYDRELRYRGAVLSAGSLSISIPSDLEDRRVYRQGIKAAYVVCRDMPASAQRAALAYTIVFIASMLFRRDQRPDAQPGSGSSADKTASNAYEIAGLMPAEMFELLRFNERATGFLSAWFQCMPAATVQEYEDEILRLGRRLRLRIHVEPRVERIASHYIRLWNGDSRKWPIGRFGFHLPPAPLGKVPQIEDDGSRVATHFRLFAEAVALSFNVESEDSTDEAWLDRNISQLLDSWPGRDFVNFSHEAYEFDSLDFDHFVQWLTDAQAGVRDYSLPSRLAIVLSHERPSLAGGLIEALYSIVQSRPSQAIPEQRSSEGESFPSDGDIGSSPSTGPTLAPSRNVVTS
jgi:hypothetical protein